MWGPYDCYLNLKYRQEERLKSAAQEELLRQGRAAQGSEALSRKQQSSIPVQRIEKLWTSLGNKLGRRAKRAGAAR
jgi:hypothetical protein